MRVIVGTVIEDTKEAILSKIRDLKDEETLDQDYLKENLSADNPLIGDFADEDVKSEHLEEFFRMCGGKYLSEGWGEVEEDLFLNEYTETYAKVEE